MQQKKQKSLSNTEDQFLKFLHNESNYLESEQSQEAIVQSLTKCKTEHALQTVNPQMTSNSFTIFDKKVQKFTFAMNECLEWETLQKSLKSEVYQLLSYMKQQCYLGNIIYMQEQLKQLFADSRVQVHNPEDFLQRVIEKGWILKTTRVLNDQEMHFYSLSIKNLTFESLVWVIKSIKKDMITPTERILNSRIKECFGLKLNKSEMDYIVNQINSIRSVVKFRNAQGKQIELPVLTVKRIKDPLINEETIGIYFSQQPWPIEDEYFPEVEKKVEWFIFLDFIKDFFSLTCKDRTKIKGGRYGCAQFIKILGPKQLRDLSLGRLTLFVQMAVDKSIIKYNKTILIHNQQEVSNLKSEHTTDSSADGDPILNSKIKILQEQLIEILIENPDGISLAQIPQQLKERYNQELNLTELGYTKLKSFMENIKDVIQIENNGRNNYVAKVILSKVPKKIIQKIQQKKIQTGQTNDLFREKYVIQVLTYISKILSKYQYGMSIDHLYADLSHQLCEWFNFKRLNCSSFFQFLQNYAENMIVIVCQKDNQYWIYERDYRFTPPPTEYNDQQFEQILTDHFPCSLGVSIRTPRDDYNQYSSCSGSWLGRASESNLRHESPSQIQSRTLRQGPEDSHQEIKENLKFIDELLANDQNQNDYTQSIQDWSMISQQQVGMMSSIHYEKQGHSVDFDLNKCLEGPDSRRK